MTNSNGNNSVCEAISSADSTAPLAGRSSVQRHRLDRIERLLESVAQRTDSNARTIQGILEQQATDRLKREEEKAEHSNRMKLLEDNQRQLIQTQRGIANLVSSLDEDRPTMLRKLTMIENKVDSLIERDR